MKKRLFGFIFIFLLSSFACTAPGYAIETNPYPFTSRADSQRFNTLIKEIRCVVCQNQSIADSNAPLANDLRNKVYAMILDHQSDKEIKAYLVKRYGEFILLRPRFTKLTLLLWLFPLIGLLSALLILRHLIRNVHGMAGL